MKADLQEKIYRTPRTYGSPTGYDRELSHVPNWRARMAEQVAYSMLSSGNGSGWGCEIASRACDIADAMLEEFDKRGWLIEAVPAPDLDPNYGKRRPAAT